MEEYRKLEGLECEQIRFVNISIREIQSLIEKKKKELAELEIKLEGHHMILQYKFIECPYLKTHTIDEEGNHYCEYCDGNKYIVKK